MKLQPFFLERYFAKHEFNVKYLLCSSDCESYTIADLLAWDSSAQQQFHDLHLGYTESLGHPELRQAIATLYEGTTSEEILVHSGAEEAIFLFMQALLESGDHVVVHFPCYQSLGEVPRALGCEVSFWKADEDKGWALDINQLESLIKPNTKAVIINCPHNPTGYVMAQDDFTALIEICRKHDVYLFCDEVYRYLEYGTETRLPAACDAYEKAVSLGVMSKTFGLAGLRIGWIATQDKAIYEAIAALKDYTTICNSAPSEFLATLALNHKEKIITRNLSIIEENMTLLDRFFEKYSERFSWVRPKAGPIALPRYRGEEGTSSLAKAVVDSKQALLIPSSLFDRGDQHFRIGFARRNFAEGWKQFEEFIDESL
ncbi:MAG: aminotransferase class I/II-fold pyridoxal phosphate-dependent enzyme [Rickettsiales bacterium]|nr:aminotransferase class I/II-fold pyridoxal phosphate-dependent enzyme [Rickettsiales bacterium]